ncbi:uncharacterized protein LOC131161009 [Malania oleifera]|uniref:uncharacterized protein LOC131161009 n=1 Tax=Malania oleifera TaxID=397392 RepID=UPI0025AE851B|nr:uncharacterized protein LOC131161009 [Malania oleifera]
MGCRASKLGIEANALPVHIRPLLRCRFEEIRRHRKSAIKGPTLSNKELLLEEKGEQGDENSSPSDKSLHCDDPKSISSSAGENIASPNEKPSAEENLVSCAEENGVSALVAALKEEGLEAKTSMEVQPTMEGEIKCEKRMEEEPSEQEGISMEAENESRGRVCGAIAMESTATTEAKEEEKVKEEKEGGGEEKTNGNVEDLEYLYPGSPSFRIYYLNSLANKNDDYDDDGKTDSSEKSHNDETDMSKDLSDDSETKKQKRKKRRFGRVIPKGRPVAVMNLLNVRSCYYPPCSHHDRTHLLTKEAAA